MSSPELLSALIPEQRLAMAEDTDLHASAAREGDAEAFAKLYDRLMPAIFVWAKFRIHGPMKRFVEPEDIVQEVWWRALDGFSRYDRAKGASFRTWVFRIATNVFREAMRRRPEARLAAAGAEWSVRRQSLPPELSDQLTSITTRLVRREEVARLASLLGSLARDEQKLVVRCGLEGMPVADLAAEFEVTPKALQKRWERLRSRVSEDPVCRELLT